MTFAPRATGAAVLAACLLLIAIQPGWVSGLRETLFDAYQRAMPRERISAPAVVVEIDEHSLDARGQWPWPRETVAALVRGISMAGPASIGLDLLFTEPDRSARGHDAALAHALKESGRTVLGIAGLEARDRRFGAPPQAPPVRIDGGRELPFRSYAGHLQSLPELDRAAAGRGLLSADSADRVVREVPLLARVNGVLAPALSIEMLRLAMGVPLLGVEDQGGERVALRLGDLAVPMQSDGRLRVYFGPHQPARFISAEAILSGTAPQEALRDKLVLVGVTGLGLLDLQATPLGERIPGVEVHAQILEQMFDGAFLRRPTGASWIEAALLAMAGLLAIALVPSLRAWQAALLLVLLLLGFAAAGTLAFKAGWLLDAALPALGTLLVFGALLAAMFAEADRQRRSLREAQARVAGELEAARRIQMGLLPKPQSLFRAEERFQLEAWLQPARTVGGDFYDCFMVDRHRLFFIVGDVSGKGLPASLFMALAKSLTKSIALRADPADPGAILTRANAEISRDNPESLFVTAFAGVLDTRTGSLAYSNAGHEPPLAVLPGRAPETVEHSGGPPLCVIGGFEFPTAHRLMEPGETLCVVTDGITEAMNRRRELYGASRLKALLRGLADAAPKSVLPVISQDVLRFTDGAEPSDDLTLLCVSWSAAGAAAFAREGDDQPEALLNER